MCVMCALLLSLGLFFLQLSSEVLCFLWVARCAVICLQNETYPLAWGTEVLENGQVDQDRWCWQGLHRSSRGGAHGTRTQADVTGEGGSTQAMEDGAWC